MFVDTAKVLVQAGKGGDGAISFRNEIYVDKGGPDGGNGGRGGDVVFMATRNLNTLIDFRYKPELKAKDGGNGAKRLMQGRSGEDLVVKVPVGTLVVKDGLTIADLVEDGQEFVIAKGGDGGFGNAHFKSSVRQAPRMAEKGEKGDSFEASLELKLLADVGLVGFPNAGKSTLLSVVSGARPEIADYAFTTLTPNLGVAYVDEDSLLMADIPGLIEGASEGKGLGHSFLRHIERTAVLLHLIDIYSDDVGLAYKTIRGELEAYSDELAKRPEIIALTKAEGMDEELIAMQIDSLKKSANGKDIYVISALAHKGIKELLRKLVQETKSSREALGEDDFETEEIPVIKLSAKQQTEAWQVEKIESDGEMVFVVTGDKIEKFASRTDYSNYEGLNRLRDIMKKLGIIHELKRQGASATSMVEIAGNRFTLKENYHDQ